MFFRRCRLCKDEIFRNGKFKEECPAVVDPITRRRCGTRLQLKDFDLKIFESGSVHREVHLRKKKLVGFNKALDDFGGDLAVYNDYLEMVGCYQQYSSDAAACRCPITWADAMLTLMTILCFSPRSRIFRIL